jgi:hypothetical protein
MIYCIIVVDCFHYKLNNYKECRFTYNLFSDFESKSIPKSEKEKALLALSNFYSTSSFLAVLLTASSKANSAGPIGIGYEAGNNTVFIL